jgi:hypothetical protein
VRPVVHSGCSRNDIDPIEELPDGSTVGHEVEIELDSLLRRDPPANVNLEKKRELLRRLLEKEKQGDKES